MSPDRYATTPRTLLISSYTPPYIVSTRHYTNLQLTEYRQTSFVIFYLFSLLYRYLVRFFFSFFFSITRSKSFFAKLMNVTKQTTRLSVYLVVRLTIFPDLNTDRLFSCHCSKYPRVESLDRTRSTRSLSDRSVRFRASSRYCDRGSIKRHIVARTLSVKRFKRYTGRMFAKRAHG